MAMEPDILLESACSGASVSVNSLDKNSISSEVFRNKGEWYELPTVSYAN